MADPIRVLLSQTTFNTDGVTTVWNFSFSGGYLDQTHVKAQRRDTSTGAVTAITLTPAMFTGPYQLTLSPALAVGQELTIYRATPKEGPLVDFTDRAKLTEVSLDYSAKQAIFGVAEADDWRMVVSAAIESINIYQAAIATGSVASVNGRTGSVVLTKDDVGLANVDNTSDAVVVAAVLAAQNGPRFRAELLVAQAISAATITILTFNKEVSDTANCYNTSTYRFTPNKAGWYSVNLSIGISEVSSITLIPLIYKNGTSLARGSQGILQTSGATVTTYMNGTTDYLDARVFLSGADTVTETISRTSFAAHYTGP